MTRANSHAPSAGPYCTFSHCYEGPIPTIVASPMEVHRVITPLAGHCGNDGSGTVILQMLDRDGRPIDGPFNFIAMQDSPVVRGAPPRRGSRRPPTPPRAPRTR